MRPRDTVRTPLRVAAKRRTSRYDRGERPPCTTTPTSSRRSSPRPTTRRCGWSTPTGWRSAATCARSSCAEVELAGLPKRSRRARGLKARLRELRPEMGADWLALLDRTQVEGCFRFGAACPQRWEQLKTTDESHVRFCESCRKNVYFCGSTEHAQRHANFGHCVAIDSRTIRDSEIFWTPLSVFSSIRFWVGQQVGFRSGPHRGSMGTISRLNFSGLRAVVSIDYAGRLTSEEIDFEDLEPVR